MTIAIVISATAVVIALTALFIAGDPDVPDRVLLTERQINVLISDMQKLDDAIEGMIRVLRIHMDNDAEHMQRICHAMSQVIEGVHLTATDIRIDLDMLDLQVRGAAALAEFDDPRFDQ